MSAAELPPSLATKPRTDFPPSIAARYTLDGRVVEVVNFGDTNSLVIDKCGRADFQFWLIAPRICDLDGVLLGELDKIVTVSETRIESIVPSEFRDGNVCTVSMRGVPGETVHMTTYGFTASEAVTTSCLVAADGKVEMQITGDWSTISCTH